MISDARDNLYEQRLRALKEELAGRTGELEASERKRHDVEAELAQVLAARKQADSLLKTAETDLEAARAEATQLAATMAMVRTELEKAQAEAEQLSAALMEAEAAHRELAQRFESVLSSTSWKVTAPLRKAVRWLRRQPAEAEERGAA